MAGEIARLWATVGADIGGYQSKLSSAERLAQQAARNIEHSLGSIQMGTPAGWERAGGLLLPSGTAADIATTGQAIKGVTGQTMALGTALKQVGGLLGINLGLQGARQVAGYAVEVSQLGAQVERLGVSFETLAGANADRMLEGMREAARGTISDMALIQAANKAMLLDVTQNADEMARLLEVASVRGRAMGLSAEQAFSDIVTGIGRVSPMILDNLGILTGGQKGFEQYAESIGKTAEQLTDLEKRQYLLNKVLTDDTTAALAAAQAAEDEASKYERFAAAVENYKAQIGGGWVGSVTGWLAGGAATAIETFTRGSQQREQIAEFRSELERLAHTGKLTQAEIAALTTGLNNLEARTQVMFVSTEQFNRAMADVKALAPNLAAALEEDARAIAMMGIDAAHTRAEVDLLKAAMRGLSAGPTIDQDALWDYTFEFTSSGEQRKMLQEQLSTVTEGSKEYYDILSKLTRLDVQAADAQWDYTFAVQDTAGQLEMLRERLGGLEVGTEEYWNALTQIADLEERLGDETTAANEKRMREAERMARQWQSTLRSMVEGVLSPTAVTAVDWWQTEMGTYGGQWDEYARRIRSAIQDPMSEWKHLVPGDILGGSDMAKQGWLQQQLDAFYSGQLPGEIDWEAFDRQLQQQLDRDRAREAMIQTAMARAGGIASKQDVAAALGIPLAPSEMLSMDLNALPAQLDLGRPITDAFTKQLEAEQKRWEDLGKTAIGWFAVGAEEGVTPATGVAIANRLFPYFAEMLDSRYTKRP